MNSMKPDQPPPFNIIELVVVIAVTTIVFWTIMVATGNCD